MNLLFISGRPNVHKTCTKWWFILNLDKCILRVWIVDFVILAHQSWTFTRIVFLRKLVVQPNSYNMVKKSNSEGPGSLTTVSYAIPPVKEVLSLQGLKELIKGVGFSNIPVQHPEMVRQRYRRPEVFWGFFFWHATSAWNMIIRSNEKKVPVCLNSYLVYGLILMKDITFGNLPIFKFFFGRFDDFMRFFGACSRWLLENP